MGAYALIEFTQALPRAKLYSNWQVVTNDQAVLDQLAATSFDPERSVFVAGGLPAPLRRPPAPTTNAGTVEFASYAPKDIVLRSDAPAPSVLLLNDRFDPNWKVTGGWQARDVVALQLHHARRLSPAGRAHGRVPLPAAGRAALRQPGGDWGWSAPARFCPRDGTAKRSPGSGPRGPARACVAARAPSLGLTRCPDKGGAPGRKWEPETPSPKAAGHAMIRGTPSLTVG